MQSSGGAAEVWVELMDRRVEVVLHRYLVRTALARSADKWKSLPKGWTEESVEKFWKSLTSKAPKHPVSRCIRQMDGKIDDPGAFCASLADRAKPGWRKDR